MLFISPQKLLLFSRYLSFCLDFLVMYQNGLIRKIRLIPNFMTSQPGQQTLVIRILPNILRCKGNQTMKFGQLIECNIRNIFLEKSYPKCGGETSPRPFSGKLNLSISLDQQAKVLYSLILENGKFSVKLRAIEIDQNEAADRLFSPHVRFFQKTKVVRNQPPCLIYRIIFEEKYFSSYILLIGQIALFGCLYFVRYWAICVL